MTIHEPELGDDIIDLRDIIDYLDEADEDGGDVARAVLAGFVEDGLVADRDDFEDFAHNEPTMIHTDYFEDYARELAEDIGAVDPDAGWPARCIDWKAAADELKMDYSEVDIHDPVDGLTERYFIRNY